MVMPQALPDQRELRPFSVGAHGHEFTFHPSGPERLEALLALIRDATVTLELCFYIFADDAAGRMVRDALADAARRGVAVMLVIDRFGTTATEAFFAPLTGAGGECRFFGARWGRRYLIRNHQKMAIADRRRAMIGGFNIADAYFSASAEDRWSDLGLLVEGPAVDALARWFDALLGWVRDGKAQWRSIRHLVRGWHPGTGPVRLLVGGPTRALSSWVRAVKHDLEGARRLDMVMAYFTPSPGLLRRIRRLARRGRARLLLAAHSDNAATVGASRLLYGRLLRNGTEIWEFRPCNLHMKLIVLDDAVYVGSANFDMRSLFLNLELMLRIEDAELAKQVRAMIAAHLALSDRITPELHRQRATFWNRIRWTLSWFLVAVLDYTVTRRLNLGL